MFSTTFKILLNHVPCEKMSAIDKTTALETHLSHDTTINIIPLQV